MKNSIIVKSGIKLLLVILLMSSGSIARGETESRPGKASGNLIKNGGFEQEDELGLGVAEGWQPRFMRKWITLDNTISRSGKKSLKISPNKHTGVIECCRQTVPVEGGRKYRVSFWWKSERVNLAVKRLISLIDGKVHDAKQVKLRSSLVKIGY